MKIRKMFCLAVAFSMIMSMVAFANDLTWENLPGHHDQSILLGPEELTSQDIVYRNARGEIISHGL